MELPDRVAQQLDGETVQSAVSLGDEDLVCFTPTRTILYSGQGLLSDESTEIFEHDIERLGVSEGRRKTKFSLEYVDSVESFTVSKKRAEQVLERLLAGVLKKKGVIDDEESVAGIFPFSELTLVVTDRQLIKHVGSYVWDPDFEAFPFSEVTGLEFEEGSVATQIVISVGGRPERIKAPTDQAEKLRRALTEVLFAYHGVTSLSELNEAVREEAEPPETTDEIGLGLEDGISPLVSDDEQAADETSSSEVESVGEDGTTLVSGTAGVAQDDSGDVDSGGRSTVDPAEIEAMQEQIGTLTEAVEQQNDQLKRQQETIETLIEELKKHV